METKNNQLVLGGVLAEKLVADHNSPLYVYEEDVLRQRYKDLVENIDYPKIKILYACKANTNLEIMRIFRGLGSHIDSVSPGEVFLAIKAGYSNEQILYTGDMTTDDEMKLMIKQNILVNVGSLSQLKRYGELNPGSEVCVRINPDIGAGHHGHTITGGPESKFGIYYDKVDKLKTIASQFSLKIVGIHSHIGSGILDTKTWLEAMDMVLNTAKDFNELEFVDFGGGIGVPYRPEQKPVNLPEFGKAVGDKFKEFCDMYGKELDFYLEPGRYLVAEAGFLLGKVNTIKNTPNHKFAGINTGFNLLRRPMTYGSYHPIYNASNMEGDTEGIIIAGNICESGDVFTQEEGGKFVDRELPEIHEGDIIAIGCAGAYGFSMSSQYNSRLRPAEILVKDGEARVIREAEKFEDLLKGQI